MNPRAQLLRWIKGDRTSVERLWEFHGTRALCIQGLGLARQYAEQWPDESATRCELEAQVDILANMLGKDPFEFLKWLAEFSGAASEIMELK